MRSTSPRHDRLHPRALHESAASVGEPSPAGAEYDSSAHVHQNRALDGDGGSRPVNLQPQQSSSPPDQFDVSSPEPQEYRHGFGAVFEPPVALRAARVVPSGRAVLAVAVLGLIAVIVLGARWWQTNRAAHEQVPLAAATYASGPGGQGDAVGVHVGSGAPTGAGALGGAGASTSAASSGGKVLVHIAGKVKRPGVVTVKPGGRVIDAVTAAGGLAAGADSRSVNLARAVVDGEQIVIVGIGEAPVSAAGANAGGADPTAGSGNAAVGKVNLNTASQAELEQLPGVGPVLAGRILQWRTTHGKFTSVDELGEVDGVGDKRLADLRARVTV